ncbi:MAG: rhodanese-like domain-containing protein [Trueperaceae bacterium]|nr:rhodanese-like domain-containing protein [Trueperaceae bacterium]
MKKFFVILVSALFATAAIAQVESTPAADRMYEVVQEAANEGWMQIGVEDAADYIFDVMPVVVDVRTQDEWDDGHLEGAVHFPVQTIGEYLDEMPADKDTPILVYCAAGTRGFWATAYIASLGYNNVTNMRGGIRAWQEAGFPTTN